LYCTIGKDGHGGEEEEQGTAPGHGQQEEERDQIGTKAKEEGTTAGEQLKNVIYANKMASERRNDGGGHWKKG
jgi:hypothetical protein